LNLAPIGPENTIVLGVVSMWTVVVLDKNINCNQICHRIQKHLFDKCNRENISLEGKILRIEIRDTTASEDSEILKIPHFPES